MPAAEVHWTRGRRRDSLVTLELLRRGASLSQAAVAEAMGVSQPRIAKIESAALLEIDPQLSTLARYLEAIGGELEVRVRFKGGRSSRLLGPAQALPPPVAIEVDPAVEAEAKAILAEDS